MVSRACGGTTRLNLHMLRSLITILLVFAFVSPGLASIGQCEMTSQPCGDEMPCCQEAQSVTGSAAARLCCEIFCGKPLDKGAEPATNITLHASVIAPASSATLALRHILPTTAQANRIIRVVNAARCQHRPPQLFLSHSAFLI